MTELLERAVDRAKALPDDLQDEIARMVLSIAGDADVAPLTPEEDDAVVRSMEAAARGEFATDDQLHAVRAKFGS